MDSVHVDWQGKVGSVIKIFLGKQIKFTKEQALHVDFFSFVTYMDCKRVT